MAQQPTMTVIVPAHNAAHYLRRTLPALQQAWSDDYELIVVDDASTDGTAQLAEEAGAHVIRLDRQTGQSGARNAGVKAAQGRIIAFLDADVEPRPDTLRLLLESLQQRPEIAAVFGSYDDEPADPRLVSAFKNLMHHYVHQNGEPEAETFWTGCGAIRREVFEAVGPFHKVSLVCVEDIDYGHRLKDSGHRIWLRRDVLCKHLKRWSLWGLVKTDVMHRGIPWTVMMMRRGKVDNELNLGRVHRISAVMALGVLVVPVAAVLLNAVGVSGSVIVALLILSVLFLGAFSALQWNFYRFLARHRGYGFALASLPLHLLYYWYSIAAFAIGIVVHHFTKN